MIQTLSISLIHLIWVSLQESFWVMITEWKPENWKNPNAKAIYNATNSLSLSLSLMWLR